MKIDWVFREQNNFLVQVGGWYNDIVMTLDRNKYKDLFCAEAEDQIATLSRVLLDIEKEPSQAALHYAELMRSAHTIKGAAATMGYTEMAALAHAMEDVFHAAERGAITLDSGLVTVLFSGVDRLSALLTSIKESDHEESTQDVIVTLGAAATAHPQNPGVAQSDAPRMVEEQVFRVDAPTQIKVGIERLDTLMGVFEEMLMIRLKLDTMLEPALDIVDTITDPMLKQKLFFIREFRSIFGEMARLLSENQEALFSIRLVPLEQIFGQYPRMVRDLSLREKKKIEFAVIGGEIELDRTVINGLGGALAHLLRNAVDHGIETEGKITLRAFREKGRARVIVEDSGEGINYARVREVAVERGIETQEKVAGLDDAGVAEMLFHPNMSTNTTVTDISGRGVGLSAVRAFTQDVGGRIDVLSPIPEIGRGTRFTLDLPVLLATIRVLIVESYGYTFAVPFESIEKTHQFLTREVTGAAHQETLYTEDGLLPLVHLENLLGLTVPGYTRRTEGDDVRTAVIMKTEKSIIALEVDRCGGEQELLVKSLPPIFRSIKGFAGSTLLPDGRTILLLDAHGLLFHAINDILKNPQIHV